MKTFFAILFTMLFTTLQFAQERATVKGEIIVEMHYGFTSEDLQSNSFLSTNSFNVVRPLATHRPIYLLQTTESQKNIVIQKLRDNKKVRYAFPNTQITDRRESPNDTLYDSQWNMSRIGADDVWEMTTGGSTYDDREIVVAVFDDGFFYNNEDLGPNVHKNRFETLGDANGDGCPGICGFDDDGDGLIDEDNFDRLPSHPNYNSIFAADDDENGYLDDINGLRCNTGTDNHLADTHGTSVASIVGAKGNNTLGMTGISWDVKILLISNPFSVANVIEGYSYVYDMRNTYNKTDGEYGAFIVATNYSLGIDNAFAEDFPIWCEMYNDLGSVGVLSAVATTNDEVNVDADGDMPSTCDSKYMICVGNVDYYDSPVECGFSTTHIDLAAPGDGVLTLETDNDYGTFGGTSGATPHVAGSIGLLYSLPCEGFIDYFYHNPAKVDELANVIINSGEPITGLQTRTKSGKRINVYNAYKELSQYCENVSELEVTSINSLVDSIISTQYTVQSLDDLEYAIYNSAGKRVKSSKIDLILDQEFELNIETSTLPSGLYFFVLSQEDNFITRKFFKYK